MYLKAVIMLISCIRVNASLAYNICTETHGTLLKPSHLHFANNY